MDKSAFLLQVCSLPDQDRLNKEMVSKTMATVLAIGGLTFAPNVNFYSRLRI